MDPRFAIINEPFRQEQGKGNFHENKNKFLQRRCELLERTLVIGERLRRAAYLNLRNSATDGTAQLAQRFADIGNVADSHDNVAKDSAAGNRNANAAVHKDRTGTGWRLSSRAEEKFAASPRCPFTDPVEHELSVFCDTPVVTGSAHGVTPIGLQSRIQAVRRLNAEDFSSSCPREGGMDRAGRVGWMLYAATPRTSSFNNSVAKVRVPAETSRGEDTDAGSEGGYYQKVVIVMTVTWMEEVVVVVEAEQDVRSVRSTSSARGTNPFRTWTKLTSSASSSQEKVDAARSIG